MTYKEVETLVVRAISLHTHFAEIDIQADENFQADLFCKPTDPGLIADIVGVFNQEYGNILKVANFEDSDVAKIQIVEQLVRFVVKLLENQDMTVESPLQYED